MQAFEPIRPLEFDKERTRKSNPGYDLYDVYITLSAVAPEEWAQAFENSWRSEMSSNYKRAHIEGEHIVIENCPLDSVEGFKEKISRALADANTSYGQYERQRQRVEASAQERRRVEEEHLEKLKNKLRFD